LGDWWRKRGYQLTRKKYVFYRAKIKKQTSTP
jgi:hypothetical protein